MAPETVTGTWRGIPVEMLWQPIVGYRTELVIFVNIEGKNIKALGWPCAHKTIHGLSVEQWEEIKRQFAAGQLPALEVSA